MRCFLEVDCCVKFHFALIDRISDYLKNIPRLSIANRRRRGRAGFSNIGILLLYFVFFIAIRPDSTVFRDGVGFVCDWEFSFFVCMCVCTYVCFLIVISCHYHFVLFAIKIARSSFIDRQSAKKEISGISNAVITFIAFASILQPILNYLDNGYFFGAFRLRKINNLRRELCISEALFFIHVSTENSSRHHLARARGNGTHIRTATREKCNKRKLIIIAKYNYRKNVATDMNELQGSRLALRGTPRIAIDSKAN